ncbi:MAG: hypothetical protein RR496_03825, partial [Lachnospiraceae bacterium]
MRYLTFALCKGRLAHQTLALFEKMGITCEEMKDKDSRKLIFVNEELKLRFFLAKFWADFDEKFEVDAWHGARKFRL